ncbi:MAG TPA: sensor histidine kinase [Nitrososphaeraceae archaeon]|nr:sensor histidine kinase [Nitrososphaeraceae archaeon]
MFLSLPRIYKIGILSVITIVIFSFALFYSIQTVTENSVRSNLLAEQIDRQRTAAKSMSQHIGSDLTLVMTVLDGLTNSIYLQQGEIYSEKAKSVMEEKYNTISDTKYKTINEIVDKIFVLDNNDVVTAGLSQAGANQYLGADFSQREWVKEAKRDTKPVFSKGFERQGIYTIYIAVPIINQENNQYMGLIGASIPTEKFFARYGNVHDINSQFLVIFDKDGTILAVGADRSLVGKNFFGKTVQNFVAHNEILNNLTRTLLSGNSAYAIYDYGRTERINTAQPILVQSTPTYFLELVTPTKEIFSKIGETLFTERLKGYSLLVAVFASVAALTIFLLKWSNTMEKEVIKRTNALNKSNVKLGEMSQDLRNSNLSLQKANEQLSQNDKLQKEFINMAAHELRTPIQPILGLADVLRDHISDSHQSKLLDIIMRNARRLQRLSGDILDVSKIESSLLKISKSPIDLNEKIRTVINDIQNGYDTESNKNVKFLFQPKDSITVYADRDRIYQVLSNLMNNAIKFTKNGTVTINASVNHKTTNHNKEAIVTIMDTGSGIAPEIMPKLFSKFVTSSQTGTGLGLFISKGIIEAHGGRIWAENNSNGVGASFSFSLPLNHFN